MSALVIAAIVVIVVISTSLGGSGDTSKPPHARGPNKRKEPHAKYYVVQPGDTFAGIAQKEGFTVQRLEGLNPNLDTQLLPENGCINLVPEGCKVLAKGG